MPRWYYDKTELQNTPSIRDGIDYETECRYRREAARLIIDITGKLGLSYNTMATAVVYLHRFYMFHSFKQFPRYVTACCCLLLAGKVEETPKQARLLIKVAKTLLPAKYFLTFGKNPKKEIVTLEKILLQTIKFDLHVEHPYKYLKIYAKCLKGDKHKCQKMLQMAWNIINDSLVTTLSLQWEPEIIAVAVMYLASKLSRFQVVDWKDRQPKHRRWWDVFIEDLSMDILEDICHQVLDLFSPTHAVKPPDSPPLTPSPHVDNPVTTSPAETVSDSDSSNGTEAASCNALKMDTSTLSTASTGLSGYLSMVSMSVSKPVKMSEHLPAGGACTAVLGPAPLPPLERSSNSIVPQPVHPGPSPPVWADPPTALLNGLSDQATFPSSASMTKGQFRFPPVTSTTVSQFRFPPVISTTVPSPSSTYVPSRTYYPRQH